MWPKRVSELLRIPSHNYEDPLIFGCQTDTRNLEKGELFIAIKGEQFDGHDYVESAFEKGAHAALVDKNWKGFLSLNESLQSKCLRVHDVLGVFRELAHSFRKTFNFPLIAIGGANGKTTTKELLVALLSGNTQKVTKTEKSQNGYLGIPITLCQRAHSSSMPPKYLVLEIGIDDIGSMEKHIALASPDTVLLTALGPEHLNGLRDTESAIQEELVLFKDLRKKIIWQLSDERLKKEYSHAIRPHHIVVLEKKSLSLIEKLISHNVNKVILWSAKELSLDKTLVTLDVLSLDENNYKTKLSWDVEIPLPGQHNAANFALAFATAFEYCQDIDAFKKGLLVFDAPKMRSNIITVKENLILYNDAYNSSPLSLKAAFDVLMSQKKYLALKKVFVLGDMLDLGKQSKKCHTEIAKNLIKFPDTHLCLYGTAMYDCFQEIMEKEIELEKQRIKVTWLPSSEDPKLFLDKITELEKVELIFVKGSRGMKLERFTQALISQCG